MTYDQSQPPQTTTCIHETIAQHGALRVLAAAISALFSLRPSRLPPPSVSELDDHLRRDIGLPPVERANSTVSPYLR